jgi:transposase-like protein
MQVVLLMRGICKGETTLELAAELKLNYKTVLNVRHLIQANAELEQPKTPLLDRVTETDEMFQNSGEKGTLHPDPEDPPRIRANKQRGHGTYDNDRPPIVGTVGRESGQVRFRVVHHTDRKTLENHVHQFTQKNTTCNTDEWLGYDHIIRDHKTVCHAKHEWARDDDDDGIREVHTNSAEGMWTDVRNYIRPFKGVHKKYLSGYIAIAEFRRNFKCVAPAFIAIFVALHTVYT